MKSPAGSCPMTKQQLLDEYFIENRTKILDLAAYLDRLDRASNHGATERDFRIEALQEALRLLSGATQSRVNQIQMILSDPTAEPLEKLGQRSARGAYDRWNQEAS